MRVTSESRRDELPSAPASTLHSAIRLVDCRRAAHGVAPYSLVLVLGGSRGHLRLAGNALLHRVRGQRRRADHPCARADRGFLRFDRGALSSLGERCLRCRGTHRAAAGDPAAGAGRAAAHRGRRLDAHARPPCLCLSHLRGYRPQARRSRGRAWPHRISGHRGTAGRPVEDGRRAHHRRGLGGVGLPAGHSVRSVRRLDDGTNLHHRARRPAQPPAGARAAWRLRPAVRGLVQRDPSACSTPCARSRLAHERRRDAARMAGTAHRRQGAGHDDLRHLVSTAHGWFRPRPACERPSTVRPATSGSRASGAWATRTLPR